MTRRIRISVFVAVITFLVLWIGASLPLAAGSLRQEVENRVGLVVVHEDGAVVTQCVAVDQPEVTGLQVLEQSGLDLNYDPSNPMGAAVCRIDGEGCGYPQDDCFCRCLDVPCFYWSYWTLTDGAWRYSQLGAAGRRLVPGEVDAWVWSEGTLNQDADRQPPALTFADICLAPTATPTDTLVPTATATSTPSATPTPSVTPSATPSPTHTPLPTVTSTATPIPTATPTPLPDAPVIVTFTADSATVDPGAPVLLTWRVVEATAVTLQVNDGQQPVAAEGSLTVNPQQTTGYVLIARNGGGEARQELMVAVTAPTVPPTVTPTVTASPTAVDTATPVPTPTASATPLPSATPSPTFSPSPAPSLTPTPIVGPIVVVTPLADAQPLDGPMTRVLLGGLAFLVGLPFVFAGIFFVVWKVWRRD